MVKRGVKCVVLTALDDVLSVSNALAAGANGYILKGVSGLELIGALKAIHSGEPYVTAELAARLLIGEEHRWFPNGMPRCRPRSPIESSSSSTTSPRAIPIRRSPRSWADRRHHQGLSDAAFQKTARAQSPGGGDCGAKSKP